MFVRSIAALIPYNAKNEILLQHRTTDAPYYPDFWGFFGGGIETGETPEESLIREAKEELELEIENYEFFKRYEIEEEKGVYERYVYLLPISLTAEQLRAQQKEGAGLDFFTIDKIHELKFNPYNFIIIKDIVDYLSSRK